MLKAEGCFSAAIVMLQYIDRWQGDAAILDLIDMLAAEGYEDLKDTVMDSKLFLIAVIIAGQATMVIYL